MTELAYVISASQVMTVLREKRKAEKRQTKPVLIQAKLAELKFTLKQIPCSGSCIAGASLNHGGGVWVNADLWKKIKIKQK
jgi:hypothetical protein